MQRMGPNNAKRCSAAERTHDAHALQGIRRPRKAERKRIRKQTDGGDAQADGKQRTALERVQEQLGFANEGEGARIPCRMWMQQTVELPQTLGRQA